MSLVSRIVLHKIELFIYLGWGEAERSEKQRVTLDLTVRFPQPPRACTSDDLQDTFCYDTLITALKAHLAERPFRLIEYLGADIYQFFKQQLRDANMAIRITKMPAIPDLTGGVSFCYGDEDVAWLS